MEPEWCPLALHGVGGWVPQKLGTLRQGQSQFCCSIDGCDIDRLPCLSHLGLSPMLKMVCFTLFFFVLSVGPVLVMASSQSVSHACLLVSEWSLAERLGGSQRNMGSVFFTLCPTLVAAPPQHPPPCRWVPWW